VRKRIIASLCLFFVSQILCLGQDTTFTYQGSLRDGTNAATGKYDFVFSVFASTTGGGPLVGSITNFSVNVNGGIFSASLNFGGAIFDGADRWLEISVRTNNATGFLVLSPRQKITASPYAITAKNVTGVISSSQLNGPLPPGVFSGAVLFTNSANAFAGSGTGLTNIQGSNVVGVANVINVLDYGAVPSPGTLDCTLAISNAIKAAVSLRRPIYFPGCAPGNYYKISDSFQFDEEWLTGVNIPGFDNSEGIIINGGGNAIIAQFSNKPVFVFTNGLNGIRIQNLSLRYFGGAASSTRGAIEFLTSADGTKNTDVVKLDFVSARGWKYGLFSESGCVIHADACQWEENQWGVWLVNTNRGGVSGATGNNSVTFTACTMVNNWNGSYVRGGSGIIFDSTESGGPQQTNFVTLDTASGAALLLRGGNVELNHGAAVNVIGSNPSQASIRFESFGLHNFGSPFLLWNTNRNACPQIVMDQATGIVRDDSPLHTISVQKGSALIVESNMFGFFRTNHAGIASFQVIPELGIDYNGPAPDPSYEGILITKYNYDIKGRTMLSYGAVSNWGGVYEQVFNYPLLQYNYDLADGKIPPAGITTNINVIVAGNKTNQLQFTNGVLIRVVPK
jgi:hypothetical protein